jgi:hypothetical protein
MKTFFIKSQKVQSLLNRQIYLHAGQALNDSLDAAIKGFEFSTIENPDSKKPETDENPSSRINKQIRKQTHTQVLGTLLN